MRGVEGKVGKHRFGFSYGLLLIAIISYLGAWGYSSYAAEWKAKADIPQIDPILKLIKGLRQYQKTNATFPLSLNEVEATVWKHPNPPPYGLGGRSMVIRNYYYLYTLISPTRSTVWAIPVGPKPEEANTYFLILTPDDREKWKGPAFDLKEVAAISGTPTYSQLALLGMIKQDSLPQKRK
ncbi:MAG: hypothetical protein QOH71_1460 [Blastocatellia bacterium]|jgi:hypothetical protein|nr:hypothetical protein [Blastocatellia bacterium]